MVNQVKQNTEQHACFTTWNKNHTRIDRTFFEQIQHFLGVSTKPPMQENVTPNILSEFDQSAMILFFVARYSKLSRAACKSKANNLYSNNHRKLIEPLCPKVCDHFDARVCGCSHEINNSEIKLARRHGIDKTSIEKTDGSVQSNFLSGPAHSDCLP